MALRYQQDGLRNVPSHQDRLVNDAHVPFLEYNDGRKSNNTPTYVTLPESLHKDQSRSAHRSGVLDALRLHEPDNHGIHHDDHAQLGDHAIRVPSL